MFLTFCTSVGESSTIKMRAISFFLPEHRALNARRVSNLLQLYTSSFAGSRENLASAPEAARQPAAEFAAFERAVAAGAAHGGGVESPARLRIDQDQIGLRTDRERARIAPDDPRRRGGQALGHLQG